MAGAFNWFRPGYELVNVKLEWNVQVPFLQSRDGKGKMLGSSLFSPQETPNSKWKLEVFDGCAQITIYASHCNSAGKEEKFLEPALVNMSIVNKRGKKKFFNKWSHLPQIDLM